ncbi:hypothetical protein NPIL_210151 [Nephila pilipes]|uniref:Uncharacterized protein n=1 Tax=Nephila pilipes TaxID=299642 RepID=A0A8X6PH31_NEPPI|nr:hypothetical protein NPIL_210151 [Nephila pilipes]
MRNLFADSQKHEKSFNTALLLATTSQQSKAELRPPVDGCTRFHESCSKPLLLALAKFKREEDLKNQVEKKIPLDSINRGGWRRLFLHTDGKQQRLRRLHADGASKYLPQLI